MSTRAADEGPAVTDALLMSLPENSLDGMPGAPCTSCAAMARPRTLGFWAFAAAFEATMLALFYVCTAYSETPAGPDLERYSAYQHTHTMIFVGFGFLYTFMRKYSFSGLGFNLLLACQAIQWSTLTNWFFRAALGASPAGWAPATLDVSALIEGDYAAAAALIALGVLLGKASATQLSVMALLMMPAYSLNQTLCEHVLLATDAGGSMFIHTFGAAFGLACAWAHRGRLTAYAPHTGTASTRTTDTFALVGSVFLFVYWPSFNAALLDDPLDRQRALVNTVLSLSAAAPAALAASSCLRAHARSADGRPQFDPWDLANGVLGGGVAIGTTCVMRVGPAGALTVGALAGVLAVVGFAYVQPALQARARVHDSCGVQSLHAMCGVLGVLASIPCALLASASQYGGADALVRVFPARAEHGALAAGGAQLLALALTLAIAATSGVGTGYVMQLGVLDGPTHKGDMYTDAYDWALEEGTAKDDQAPVLDV